MGFYLIVMVSNMSLILYIMVIGFYLILMVFMTTNASISMTTNVGMYMATTERPRLRMRGRILCTSCLSKDHGFRNLRVPRFPRMCCLFFLSNIMFFRNSCLQKSFAHPPCGGLKQHLFFQPPVPSQRKGGVELGAI